MRYIFIALLTFCIHVSASFYIAIDPFDMGGGPLTPNDQWFDAAKDPDISQYSESAGSDDSDVNLGFGDFVKGLALFIGTFAMALFIVPYTMVQLGLVTELAIILSIPIYAVYLMGIVQFIANRNMKTMN